MRRFAVAALFVCATMSLGFLSVAAKAGDYYDGGYRYRASGNVSYSSSCCYRKVVRQVRSVRYVRVDHGGYHDRPYRQSYYSDWPRRYVSDGYAPRRYVNDVYVSPRYVDNVDYNDGYYNAGYSSYAQTCTWRRDRIYDGRGGWIWGERRRVCY